VPKPALVFGTLAQSEVGTVEVAEKVPSGWLVPFDMVVPAEFLTAIVGVGTATPKPVVQIPKSASSSQNPASIEVTVRVQDDPGQHPPPGFIEFVKLISAPLNNPPK
jgi:hypothetical protein